MPRVVIGNDFGDIKITSNQLVLREYFTEKGRYIVTWCTLRYHSAADHFWEYMCWRWKEFETSTIISGCQAHCSEYPRKQCLKAKKLYAPPPKNIFCGSHWHIGDLWAKEESSSKFFWFTKMCFFLTQIQEMIMPFLHLWCCNSSVEMPWALQMLLIKDDIIYQIKKGKVQKEILYLEIIAVKT